jgi:glycosyltransferase involved in cell wall biosynthesis
MLVECLESIRNQTHQDYEVILKDAYPQEPVTSHSQVCEILYSMPKVKYICQPDTGMTDGLNQALYNATGEILHIVCGDDSLGSPKTLEIVDEKFVDNFSTEAAWLYGSTGCLNEDSSEGPWGIQPPTTLEEMLIHNRMGTPATYWNRAMFEKVGYFEYALASDYDYWCRCYRIAEPDYSRLVLGLGRRWNKAASWTQAGLVEQEAYDISNRHTQFYLMNRQPPYVPYP